MKEESSALNYNGYILGFDDVLYPEKDYLLQVYYLFAQFMEYNEQMDGNAIVPFMKDIYEKEGPADLFSKTAAKFGIPQTYLKNYALLHQTARLPLKLMLFDKMLSFMQEAQAAGKPIFLLLEGEPVAQLNKVRQMEWHGLDAYLKVYFTVDTVGGTLLESIDVITAEHQLSKADLLCLVKDETAYAAIPELSFLSATKIR